MRRRRLGRRAVALAACLSSLAALSMDSPAVEPVDGAHEDEAHEDGAREDGADPREALYAARCASCHSAATGRTPSRSALRFVPPGIIVRSLTDGTMRPMATGLGEDEIRALATLLSSLPDRPPQLLPARCTEARAAVAPDPNGWPSTSRDASNSRYQPAPGLREDEVPRLQLAWALAIPGGASGSPVVSDGRIFISTGAGQIGALDAQRRCTLWTYEHARIVRTLNLGSSRSRDGEARVYFADDHGYATALDATTGAERWKTRVEEHPLARATAAPVADDGRVYVAMSSIEDPLSHDPNHECCTFRGSIAALDAASGAILWKQYTIAEAAKPLAEEPAGAKTRFSPAGGAIYTPLAIDAKRGRIYAATAEAYTYEDPPGPYSVIAFDAANGQRVWERQFLPGSEERAAACEANGYTDCRNLFSMGTSVTIHQSAEGGDPQDLLLVGQKWGMVYALDPDAGGAVVWQRRLAKGGDMGGIMYGIASDGRGAYVPVSDLYAEAPERAGDLVALDARSGATRWRAKQPDAVCSWGKEACVGAQVAAPTVIPGVVFTSAWDGFVRAHSIRDGSLLWQFDTGRAFEAINGDAHGGQIGAYPIQVVDGAVYVTSGASSQAKPGNALLVFTAAEETD